MPLTRDPQGGISTTSVHEGPDISVVVDEDMLLSEDERIARAEAKAEADAKAASINVFEEAAKSGMEEASAEVDDTTPVADGEPETPVEPADPSVEAALGLTSTPPESEPTALTDAGDPVGVPLSTDATAEVAPESVAPETVDAPPPATPAAIAHADELGVDLTQVEGTGKDGTILKSDVAAAVEGGDTPQS